MEHNALVDEILSAKREIAEWSTEDRQTMILQGPDDRHRFTDPRFVSQEAPRPTSD
jgi:hypothetical protein